MGLPLTADDIDRLGKFLGMLGSTADTERALAGAKADALLRDRGTDWADIIAVLKVSAARPDPCHRADARECLAVLGIWSARELAFLANMARRHRAPTDDQAQWLARLLEEARLVAQEAA